MSIIYQISLLIKSNSYKNNNVVSPYAFFNKNEKTYTVIGYYNLLYVYPFKSIRIVKLKLF